MTCPDASVRLAVPRLGAAIEVGDPVLHVADEDRVVGDLEQLGLRANRSSSRSRSAMSRMAALTSTPSWVSSGLRLISAGNSPPSFRLPHSSNPSPIGRARSPAAKPARCPVGSHSGTRTSTSRPSSSSRA